MRSLFIFLSLFTCGQILANTVVYIKEPARFELPSATKNKIVKGSKLEVGSRVHVGESGLVVLKGSDGSVVKLDENSSLEITKMAKSSQSNDETMYSIVKGSGFFNFPKNPNKKTTVRTKTASMGVRGTEFFVAHGKSSDVWMCVNEGLVAVTSTEVTKPVLVKAGEGIKLAGGTSISDPKALPWTRKLNWKFDPTLGDLKNTVSIEEAYASPLEMDID
ncbi:MAG: hypothetical protein CME71_01715 [Halobacteriovorax sp.]|nr:hypothetical protein [Halobacteriovorax sp.]